MLAPLREYQKAIEHYEKAFSIAIEIGDREGEEHGPGDSELYSNHLENTRLKNITRKPLPSLQKLVIGKEREHRPGTLELF